MKISTSNKQLDSVIIMVLSIIIFKVQSLDYMKLITDKCFGNKVILHDVINHFQILLNVGQKPFFIISDKI